MLSLYKSSAGSGKTFTLVKEYLKLCLPKPDKFRNIVAITFTNAASAEMKERIISKLEGLAEGKEEDLKKLLSEEGLTPEQIGNARVVLENILHNYSHFTVSTIDSFFHKILRAFSKELDLPLDFELFLDNDKALDYSVDNFIYRSHFNPEIHKILVEYIKEKIAAGKTWVIRDDLYKIANELLKESTFLMEEVNLEKIQLFISELRKLIRDFEDKMEKTGQEALEGMTNHGLGLEDFKYGKGGPANYFNNIRKVRKNYEPGKRFVSALENEDEWLKKSSATYRQAEEALQTFLLDFAKQALHLYETQYPAYITAKEILKCIYTFSVYEEMNQILIEYKAKNGVVLISDFNKILAKHLLKEQISFIYSKIGARYEHFLLDEFQDTSSLQWENLKPLLDNALAQGAHCLIVGDSKQAIYRWRGGKIELIETQVSEQDFPQHCTKVSLSRNFRSKTEVVNFNNKFFKSIKNLFPDEFHEKALLDQIFEDAYQDPAAKDKEGGYVEVAFFRKENNRKKEFTDAALARMLQTILQAKMDGYRLRDISVLIRNNNDAANVANFLFENRVEFISRDSLFLDNSPAVRLLLSLLYYLNDTRNDLAKTQLTFLFLQYFTKKEENPIPFREILEDFTKKDDGLFHKLLPEEFTAKIYYLNTLPLYELVEELIRIFKLNAEPDAYLQRYQDVVLEYTLKQKSTLRGFLEWWEKDKYSVVMPADTDAIQIMTIHKSKGLEFPVVIIPFASWDFKNRSQQDIMWVQPQIEPFNTFSRLPVLISKNLENSAFSNEYLQEESLVAIDNLNLLYVALTRAKDRLYIFTTLEKTDKESLSNIAPVINQVLKPADDVTQDIIEIKYGELQKVNQRQSITTSNATDENEIMQEYPVFNWRGRIRLQENSKNLREAILLKKLLIISNDLKDLKKNSELLIAGNPELIENIEQLTAKPPLSVFYSEEAEKKYAAELILPGNKAFRPDKIVNLDNKIYILKIHNGKLSENEKELLNLYAKNQAEFSGKEIKTYLLDTSTLIIS